MRRDSVLFGLVCGLLAPVLGLVGYGLIYTQVLRPWTTLSFYFKDLFLGAVQYQAPLLSLALVADAFLFFHFDRTARYRSMRGVVAAMLLYGIWIVYLLWGTGGSIS